MFTGFASENTPAIQVWDFFRTFASGSAYRNIALADDCAPIQFFRTGATTTEIKVFLPTAPIEGKQIKIINNRYATNVQKLLIVSSDARGDGTFSTVAYLGPGQTIDFCYSKNCISFGTSTGTTATGWISLNQGPASSANYYSVALGGNNNVASGNTSCTVGGSGVTASGLASGVIAGQNNTASADNSTIVGGTTNTASNTSAAVVGGSSNTSAGDSCVVLGGTSNQVASGSWSLIAAGTNNYISASSCGILAGQNNTTSGDMSVVSGGRQGTTRSIIGYTVSPASSIPISNISGTNQTALLVLARQTTDATATVIRSNGAAAGTTNQVILPNNSAYYFRGECIAGVTGAGDTKGWYIEGVIKRGANAASTAIVGAATVTSLYADAGATTWAVTATADTTNGGLAITVTGQAATTIRWVCQIRTTEMVYA